MGRSYEHATAEGESTTGESRARDKGTWSKIPFKMEQFLHLVLYLWQRAAACLQVIEAEPR